MRIAIQGSTGAFHEFAARKQFAHETIEFVYCETFREAFDALATDKADQALVAIENSLFGSINDVYDLLQKHHFTITGEVMLHVRQQLIGLPNAKLQAITTVYSQVMALAQCENFLANKLPEATPTEFHDTAASVEYIKMKNNPHFAAIASRFSAHHYGLPILAENIEDNVQNYTRFVVLQRDPTPVPGADKTSLILVTDHTPGALHRALGAFAAHKVNLTTMHSRPIPEKAWRYKFYIDVDVVGAVLQEAIAELKAQDASMTVLGEYKQATTTYAT